MTSLRRSSPPRLLAAAVAVLVVCALLTVIPSRSQVARAAGSGTLRQQIDAGQSQISGLSSALHAATSRVSSLNSGISSLRSRISRIQSELNAERVQLLKLRDQLTAARTRLSQLEAFESHAEIVLARQLVNSYETDRPDIVTVVLEARGFQDLLERLAFAQRIRTEDVRVVTQVRAARRAVAAQATRLGALEARQQTLTAAVLGQRNRLAQSEVSLVQQQLAALNVRSAKASRLAGARARVAGLQRQLARIQAAQAAAAAAARARQLAAAGVPSSVVPRSSVGSSQVSSGSGFTFPMPRGAASPPGTWSLDQGVDISAPGGTPELAVCSGTIVLHGIGGFGPWAPVLHCDSSLSGGSYVYYGHAGPANELPVGTHVGAGQVIAEVGPGIVGISTGPHLEIGFADSSGAPVGGGTASQMMSLLQASYGG